MTTLPDSATFRLGYWFEWRGGCLWPRNQAARDAFGSGPLDDVLDLPMDLTEKLEALSAWHDTALDWDNPTGPSPWSSEEKNRFDNEADQTLQTIKLALGSDFEVIDER